MLWRPLGSEPYQADRLARMGSVVGGAYRRVQRDRVGRVPGILGTLT